MRGTKLDENQHHERKLLCFVNRQPAEGSKIAHPFKDKFPVVLFHEITLQYSYFKEIWIFAPIQQGTEKTWSCFALDTEHQYWAVTVQYLCRVKKISITSNVLPLHFTPSQDSSSQNSKFDSHLMYCEVDSWNVVNLSHLYLLSSKGLYL